eukprot:1770537-Pleurochrysis_carterae.AAC.4
MHGGLAGGGKWGGDCGGDGFGATLEEGGGDKIIEVITDGASKVSRRSILFAWPGSEPSNDPKYWPKGWAPTGVPLDRGVRWLSTFAGTPSVARPIDPRSSAAPSNGA